MRPILDLIIVVAAISLWHPATTAAQGDAIRIHVFASEQSSSEPIETTLSLYRVPLEVSYAYDAEQGREAVTATQAELQRTQTRRVPMSVTDARELADVSLEVVATSVRHSPQVRSRRGSGGLPAAWDDVLILRLSVRHHDYAKDFLGLRQNVLRSAVFTAVEEVRLWIVANEKHLRRDRLLWVP
jgi:hypothetical protein